MIDWMHQIIEKNLDFGMKFVSILMIFYIHLSNKQNNLIQ